MVFLLNSTTYPKARGSDLDWIPAYATRDEFKIKLENNHSRDGFLFRNRWKDGEYDHIWKELYIDYLVEANHSHFQTEPMFYHYLKACNYTVDIPTDKSLAEMDADLVVVAPVKEDVSLYHDVDRLTCLELDALKRQRMDTEETAVKLTKEQKESIDRYYFDSSIDQTRLSVERIEELWQAHNKVGGKRFTQARLEYGVSSGLVSFEKLCEDAKATIWNEGTERQLKEIIELCQMLGLKDTLEPGIVPRQLLEELIQTKEFRQRLEGLSGVFSTRKSRAKKFDLQASIHMLKEIFECWSGAKLLDDQPRKRGTVNGNRISVQPVSLVPLAKSFKDGVIPRGCKRLEEMRYRKWQERRLKESSDTATDCDDDYDDE